MSMCRGNCGHEALYGNWCKRLPIHCPALRERFNEKRIRRISETKKLQAKLGFNPMQNSEICKKNHSPERNRKASESLKSLGKLGLLPQQTESPELKEKRRVNVSRKLKQLYLEGIHPRQRETIEKRRQRLQKMAVKLRELSSQNKLPIQNMTSQQKIKFGKKMSQSLLKAVEEGRLKLNDYGKRIPYNSNGRVFTLRSNWEKTTAEFLDKKGINWIYEPFKVKYWDNQREVYAFTFPDFFLPDLNIIIEVKGNGEFNSQKTQDKLDGIRKSGFKALIFGKKEIKQIRERNTKKISKLIFGETDEEN